MDDAVSRELDEITLHHQADVGRLWQLLMRPLGFTGRSLWLTFIGPDRRPVRALTEIAECDEVPSPLEVDRLFTMLARLLREEGRGCSVALLVTRPGRGGIGPDDRRLGRLLLAGARKADVPLEPLHVATDRDVLALAPDDLAA